MQALAIKAAVSLVMLLGVFASGWRYGVTQERKDCDLARAESVSRAIDQERSIARQDAEVSTGFEATRARIQTVYRDVEKEVVREIPADCAQCRIAPDGFRLLNDAISGRAFKATPPGEPDQSVRVPQPPTAGHVPGSGRQIGGVERKTI